MPNLTSRSCLVAVFVLAVAACGSDAGSGPSGPRANDDQGDGAQEAGAVRPAIVTDIGGLGDRGFNDLAQTGLQMATEELGTEGQVVEPASPTDYARNLAALAEAGASPIFGIGFSLQDAVAEVAPEYPETNFGIVDAVVEEPNVASLVFREQEGSYLAGVVAGLMTSVQTEYTDPDNKVVGFIGGQESPLIEKFEAGYTEGVLSVCPECTILGQYIGTTTEAFTNPAGAAEIARLQHSDGADIIYHAASASGAGLFDVAQMEQFFAIGVDTDQTTFFPDAPILTSVLKRVDTAVADTIAAAAEGEFEAGTYSFGLVEDGIDLAGFGRFADVVPQEVNGAVNEARDAIIAGNVQVPTEMADVSSS